MALVAWAAILVRSEPKHRGMQGKRAAGGTTAGAADLVYVFLLFRHDGSLKLPIP